MNEFHRGLHKLLVREMVKFKALCPRMDFIIIIFTFNYFRRADSVVKLQKNYFYWSYIMSSKNKNEINVSLTFQSFFKR